MRISPASRRFDRFSHRERLRRAFPDVDVDGSDEKPGRDDRDFVEIPMRGTTSELA
jgi:hypothetical protein